MIPEEAVPHPSLSNLSLSLPEAQTHASPLLPPRVASPLLLTKPTQRPRPQTKLRLNFRKPAGEFSDPPMLIKRKTPSLIRCHRSACFPPADTHRKRESLYGGGGNGGGSEGGWQPHGQPRPVAHLGPIKETWRPRPPHALMHDAHSPMHCNEY